MSQFAGAEARPGGAMCQSGSGMTAEPGKTCRSGPAVLRGVPAQARSLDAEKPVAYEIHQGPVEGGAVRLMAERLANVIAVEDFGEPRESRLDVRVGIAVGPP